MKPSSKREMRKKNVLAFFCPKEHLADHNFMSFDWISRRISWVFFLFYFIFFIFFIFCWDELGWDGSGTCIPNCIALFTLNRVNNTESIGTCLKFLQNGLLYFLRNILSFSFVCNRFSVNTHRSHNGWSQQPTTIRSKVQTHRGLVHRRLLNIRWMAWFSLFCSSITNYN